MHTFRVVHYCNQLSLGGTERTMEIFCRMLDRGIFDVHAVAKRPSLPLLKRAKIEVGALLGHKVARAKKKMRASLMDRMPRFIAALGADHVHVAENDEDLERIILGLSPHVLHIHYSGVAEAPITLDPVMAKVPVVVTTNQFEIENQSPNHARVARMYFVSQWLLDNKATWAKRDPRARVMYNLTDPPEATTDLRAELHIPHEAFVIGRVGRADNGIHDPISLEAVARMQDDRTWFLALNPPPAMVADAKRLGLRHFVPLPGTADSVWLSRFYNTMDVLAHARRDGETFGCNIAEAMIHGKPVVSHLCAFMNAQTETVADGGTVVAQGDATGYAEALRRLRDDRAYYAATSARALNRAQKDYESSLLVHRLKEDYLALLADKGFTEP